MPPNRAERYRESMRSEPYGYALYHPQEHTRLRPGMLGYLDENKHWHPLLDLRDPQAIANLNLPALKMQMLNERKPEQWGPKTASTVKETTIKLGGDVDAASLGLPLDVGGAVQYSSASDFGAILMCDDKVVPKGFDERKPFLLWLKSNSKALLKQFPDLKDYGVIVATWTYSASQIYIHVWEDKDKTVVVGVKAGATGVGHGETENVWRRAHSSDGWTRFDDGARVVFFTGVGIKYTFLGVKEQKEHEWRGEDEMQFVVENVEDSMVAEAKAETFGDDWEDIENARQEQEDSDDD